MSLVSEAAEYLVHRSSMAVHGSYRSIFQQVADVEQLLEVKSMFLASLIVRTNVVELSKLGCKCYMAGIIKPCAWKADHAVLLNHQLQHAIIDNIKILLQLLS